MNLAVEHQWVLWGLILMVLPLLNSGMQTIDQPWLALLPQDKISQLLAFLLRLLAMLIIAFLVLGIAGLHLNEQTRERIGKGANIVLLLDRSNSMENSFAGRTPEGNEESKANAARRLLAEFVQHRPADRVGVAAYSTAPLFVMPLTANKSAVEAAIAATKNPALAYTHVAKGLSMALGFFQQPAQAGARIVVLVSDGAAAINKDDEQKLRAWFQQYQVRLYWLFLRTANSPGIYDQPQDARDDNAQAMPERYLHQFFSSLHTPYQAYEAESPLALQKAIQDINQLENQPLHYTERLPRTDLSGLCYLGAALLMLLLLGVKFLELRKC